MKFVVVPCEVASGLEIDLAFGAIQRLQVAGDVLFQVAFIRCGVSALGALERPEIEVLDEHVPAQAVTPMRFEFAMRALKLFKSRMSKFVTVEQVFAISFVAAHVARIFLFGVMPLKVRLQSGFAHALIVAQSTLEAARDGFGDGGEGDLGFAAFGQRVRLEVQEQVLFARARVIAFGTSERFDFGVRGHMRPEIAFRVPSIIAEGASKRFHFGVIH